MHKTDRFFSESVGNIYRYSGNESDHPRVRNRLMIRGENVKEAEGSAGTEYEKLEQRISAITFFSAWDILDGGPTTGEASSEAELLAEECDLERTSYPQKKRDSFTLTAKRSKQILCIGRRTSGDALENQEEQLFPTEEEFTRTLHRPGESSKPVEASGAEVRRTHAAKTPSHVAEPSGVSYSSNMVELPETSSMLMVGGTELGKAKEQIGIKAWRKVCRVVPIVRRRTRQCLGKN